MASRGGPTEVGVALKWVDLRPEIDPITGTIHDDLHSFGWSAADQAALEWALRLADVLARADGGTNGGAGRGGVVAVTVGPAGADAILRDALAAGATRAVRVEAPAGAPSEDVAAGLAAVLDGVAFVCCGDLSADRGTGSVPAFLAAELGVTQALGLVDLVAGEPGSVLATRRIDHGQREILSVQAPAVLSVEGSSARLRRAGMGEVLVALGGRIQVVDGPAQRAGATRVARRMPYRPRARAVPPPRADLDVRGRVLSLTGALVERTPPRTIHADASEAADLVLAQLRTWGYIG